MSSTNQTKLNEVLPMPIELGNSSNDFTGSHVTDVLVGEYHIIGDVRGYVVWTIKITVNDALYSSIVLYKRYSDLVRFRNKLTRNHPGEKNIPQLPSKDSLSISRFMLQDSWLEERRRGLQWFLSNVLLNPVFAEEVKEFLLNN